MRKSLLFLLNTLLAAATLCVVSCGIDDVDAEDGAIQFELYDTEGTLIEGLQSMKFGATTAYTLKSAFVTYTEVTAPAGWKWDRKSTRLNSSHTDSSRMPSSA